jgi:hypothetical protein
MNFKQNYLDLGELKVGVTKDIIFYPKEKETLEEIVSISSSCGCSTPKVENDRIIVSYTPGSIPIHLQHSGQYKTTKIITINYKYGSSETLSFTATIKK